MIPIDLSGKVALVTGVGDNESFAWFIAKALQAAGARLVFAVHPRMIRIVEGFLTGDKPDDLEVATFPYGAGSLKVEKVLPATSASTPWTTCPKRRGTTAASSPSRTARRLLHRGLMKAVKESHGGIDILIHSVAFSAGDQEQGVDTSREPATGRPSASAPIR